MRRILSAALGTALAVAALGCAGSYHVRTIAAPDAHLAALHTFRVLPAPPPRDGRDRAGAYDPMVNNSIANRALRETVTRAFEERGYAADPTSPDFVVAVYASAYEKLDVTAWDYGYPYWPHAGWGARVRAADRITVYTEGTVVVDVLRPQTRDLLWRGAASATLSRDPTWDVKALQEVAEAIVKKFPKASTRSVARR